MEKYKISIIIPVYNVEQYIEQCLNSIISQNYKNYEVWLIDDGSTDKSGIICDRFVEKDSRFKVVHKRNEGLVSSWMKGMKMSNGEYIAFIDPDDWISEQYLKIMVECLPCDFVVTKLAKARPDKVILPNYIVEAKKYNKEGLREQIFPFLLNAGGFQKRAVAMSRCGKIVKKEIIINNLKYMSKNTTFAEDVNIIFPSLLDANELCIVDNEKCLYYYRVNPNSMLHSYDSNVLNSIMHVHPSLIKACKDKGYDEMVFQVYADFLSASVQYYKNELINPNGYFEMVKNIKKIIDTDMFGIAVNTIDWKTYDILNRMIIYTMKKIDGNLAKVIIYMLKELKNYRMKKLNKQIMRMKK